jgi:RNA polymerase sigma-70 factor (ECF subfamily)
MYSSHDTEAFIRLLSEHERGLYLYVMTMTPLPSDADDILQEAKVVMWRHFGEFKLGTNFGAWARKVAFYQVMAYRKRRQRDRLCFSGEFVEAVAGELEERNEHLESRYKTLASCVAKLDPEHRQIVSLRYEVGEPVDVIAEAVGRTSGAVYRVLSRIRRSLHSCVNTEMEKNLAEGGRA